MSTDLTAPDPTRFTLTSFADILPARDPIVGEDPGSFDGFHEGMTLTLAPRTPYEAVIAENLIAIERELLQHRHMRETSVRRIIHDAICSAVVDERRAIRNETLNEAWDLHKKAGGTADDWQEPFSFDEDAAQEQGESLALRAISEVRETQQVAYAEIASLGMDPVELMGEAYRDMQESVVWHDEKAQELERRRREVKRDYDTLIGARPITVDVVEAEVIDG